MTLVLASLWLAVTASWVCGRRGVRGGGAREAERGHGGADARRAARARTRAARAAGFVDAGVGAAVVVAVLAILYARDLRGIWDGAFGYHLDTTAVNGLSGRHQLANFFDTSLHTVFLWFTAAGLAASVVVWRRVWPLWLWPAFALLFVLTYQPLRDNHLILIPYAFAVPIAVALALVAKQLRGRALPARRSVSPSPRLVCRLGAAAPHRVDILREPPRTPLSWSPTAAKLESLTRRGRLVDRQPADRGVPRRPPRPAAARQHREQPLRLGLADGRGRPACGQRRPARDRGRGRTGVLRPAGP